MFVEPAEEPDQLVDDRAEGDLLGGDEREALAEVEADLAAEDAEGVDLLARRAEHRPGSASSRRGRGRRGAGRGTASCGSSWVGLERNRAWHRLVLYAPRSLPFSSCS